MPYSANIEAPITLVAPGRSGTTLVSNIFTRHPDIYSAGETADLIFGVWHAVELSQLTVTSLANRVQHNSVLSDEELAARVVRQSLLACFPDDSPRWFHKPIGVPIALSMQFGIEQWPEAADWYWKVMRRSFPKARFFTILRHPCDVVLSAKRFWGYDEAGIWWSLGLMAYLVAHPLSPVEYAVDFDELVQNSETTVRNLFAYLDVPYVDGVLEAFSERYAAASDRKSPETHNWSRRHEWHELDPTRMNPMYTNSIVGLYAKFGKDIEFPDHFSEVQNGNTQDLVELDSALLSDSESPERRIHNLQQVIRNQDAQIGKLHQDFAKRERENYLLWQEQRSWIAELEKAKAWLEEQRDNWQRLAEERERIVQEQRAWIAELEQGKA